MKTLLTVVSALAGLLLVASNAPAQTTLVDWNFSSLVNPGRCRRAHCSAVARRERGRSRGWPHKFWFNGEERQRFLSGVAMGIVKSGAG